MTSTKSDKLSLEVERYFKAPLARVYAAWTDAGQLKKWFGPSNVQTHELVADVRVGGEFRWVVDNCDGERVTVRGVYRVVEPGKKIAFTWEWEEDQVWAGHPSLVTVEFFERDGGTNVRLIHEQLPSEESRTNHTKGWISVLEKLETFVGT